MISDDPAHVYFVYFEYVCCFDNLLDISINEIATLLIGPHTSTGDSHLGSDSLVPI